jgi:membrane-associated protease RseP (regulator of RpoE activity)
MHRQAVRTLALALAFASTLAASTGCSPEQAEQVATAEATPPLVDQALLADLLGEAVNVEADVTSADGLLLRLAFEPLIRQTGPVSLQLVQSTGYRLLGVAEGAPLWQLGFREGDVLTTVDGHAIIGREHELRSDWERRPSRAEIGYQRDGQARTLALRIRPGSAWRSSVPIASGGALVDPFARADALVDPHGRADDLADPFARSGVTANPEPELTDGVRCVLDDAADSFGRCEIERATIVRLAADPAGLAKQMRIVPTTREGDPQGFKLFGIRNASLPSHLGLKNGDVVVAVDGQPMSSLDAAMKVFTRLPKLDTFTLTLERRGATKQLTIVIVDALSTP